VWKKRDPLQVNWGPVSGVRKLMVTGVESENGRRRIREKTLKSARECYCCAPNLNWERKVFLDAERKSSGGRRVGTNLSRENPGLWKNSKESKGGCLVQCRFLQRGANRTRRASLSKEKGCGGNVIC